MKLRELTILQYQNVTINAHAHRLWLSLDAFNKQLAYIRENGFQVISLDDAIDYMERKIETNPKRPISLTFDNGFMDTYEQVFPVLAEYDYPATVLVSPEKVGTVANIGNESMPYLTWRAIRDMADQNITIGAYEDTELNITQIPEETVCRHIVDHKKRMEDQLGQTVNYYGVKEGVPRLDIRNLIQSTGYRAFLTQCPTNRKSDLFSIGRIQVDDEDFNIFLSKISKTYLFFKDKESWKYIRKYRLDRLVHRISEAYNRVRENVR